MGIVFGGKLCQEGSLLWLAFFFHILAFPSLRQLNLLTISSVVSLNLAMRETKEALENVSVGLEVLQVGTGKLNFNLSLVRTSINRTLNDPGCHDEESDATSAQLCRNIRQSLFQLQISANFTRVQNWTQCILICSLHAMDTNAILYSFYLPSWLKLWLHKLCLQFSYLTWRLSWKRWTTYWERTSVLSSRGWACTRNLWIF